MGLVSGELPGLYNGVSQQALALRLPTQGDAQDNFDATLVTGLTPRPPFEHMANIPLAGPSQQAFLHILHRDQEERYALVIRDGVLKLFAFDGTQRTVHTPDGLSYLTRHAPSAGDADAFTALTVADYTFIVNRTVRVAPSSSTFPTRPREALVHVVQGNYARTYTVTVNGTRVGEFLTPGAGLAGAANCAGAENIANILLHGVPATGSGQYHDGMMPDGTEGRQVSGQSQDVYQVFDNAGQIIAIMDHRLDPGQWALSRYASSLYLVNLTGADFSLAVEDGYNGHAMKALKDEVQSFSDLPSHAPVDYKVKIVGADGSGRDAYWVTAAKSEGQDGNSQVIWKEAVAPGARRGLDPATMPHILVREADGSFTFRRAAWDERACGDGDKVNPDPSFVGRGIEDVFFHANRLGFLADENVILSRSGDFFNFFRTTATAYLDDDPIDVAASHVKVSLLKHAVPTQNQMILFSEGTQFRLAGNDMLTPKTVALRPVTEFSVAPRVSPVAMGKSVFFVADSPANQDWAAVHEFFFESSSETADADNVTSHVPSYIPSGVTQIIGSPDEDCLAVLTQGDPAALYVHRFHWSGNAKVQSAWMRWTAPGADCILRAAFLGTDLYALVSRQGSLSLERLRMSTAALDTDHGYLVRLDRRVTSDALPAPTWSAAADTTTYLLPYAAGNDILAVCRGKMPVIAGINGSQVSLRGDTRSARVYFGYLYEARYRFSTFFTRATGADGGSVARVNGRLQLHHLALSFHDTAHFAVHVTPFGRATRVFPYHGRILGDSLHTFGAVEPEDRRLSVPIMSRNDRVSIELVNASWLPSAFVSASWRGQFNPRSLER